MYTIVRTPVPGIPGVSQVAVIPDTSHVPGRIRRVQSPILGIWHWGVEGWERDVNNEPTIWHAQKNDVLRCTIHVGFSGGQPSEILWTPQTYEQQLSVIDRLQSIEGLPWNLATANCEQVVRWAVEGRAHSEQLTTGVAIVSVVGVVALLASGA
jgi:hypothetical protein